MVLNGAEWCWVTWNLAACWSFSSRCHLLCSFSQITGDLCAGCSRAAMTSRPLRIGRMAPERRPTITWGRQNSDKEIWPKLVPLRLVNLYTEGKGKSCMSITEENHGKSSPKKVSHFLFTGAPHAAEPHWVARSRTRRPYDVVTFSGHFNGNLWHELDFRSLNRRCEKDTDMTNEEMSKNMKSSQDSPKTS